jgi:magnesium chelatase family protein
MDRIDLHVEVSAVPFDDISRDGSGESSAVVRERVLAARALQRARFGNTPGIGCNAHMGPGELRRYVRPSPEGRALLQRAIDRLGLSARAYHRLLKVGRTCQSDRSASSMLRRRSSTATLDRPAFV